ncbi:response regulator transcription factor [uncultured Pseudoteredinibacter sp.]|uniref:response regulator n=1 Tax=uncultured Pseudoteredinibacter sp. TaxID=1641701 RepID=UPI00260582EB|nr:response regulator transcription factor [uncultured Pseudoteredinibacter sp.]
MKATLLIVEDCEATRERLETAIIEGGEFRLVGSVGTFKAAAAMLENSSPDILLTDLDLPDGNGIDLIKMLRQSKVSTQLAIVITIFGDEAHVINALRAGASGYLLKDDEFFEINNAIKQMQEGGAPISPGVARFLLQEFKPAPAHEEDSHNTLSEREHEILLLVSKGYTSKEIGNMLNVSFHTVNAHVKNIYKKLAVTNRTGAIYEATKKGII